MDSYTGFFTSVFSSNLFLWANVSHPKVLSHITSKSTRYSNSMLTQRCQYHCSVKKVSLRLGLIFSLKEMRAFKICLNWLSGVYADWVELSDVNDTAELWVLTQQCQWHRWVMALDHIKKLIFTDSAVSTRPLSFETRISRISQFSTTF